MQFPLRSWPAWLLALASVAHPNAAVPPAEQLLPADTLAFATVPDWDKASAYFRQSPQARLWNDPALKDFKDHFWSKFQSDVVEPLERELGVQFKDYSDLFHGQLTVAFSQIEVDGKKKFAFALLADSKQKAPELREQLARLKKKWAGAGKQLRAENIRGLDFTTLLIDKTDLASLLKKTLPGGGDAKPEADDSKPATFELRVGQSDSLFILGNEPRFLEKIIARQTGGSAPALADQADYQLNQAMFRDAYFTAWIHFKPIFSLITEQLKQSKSAAKNPNPFAFDPAKILGALGLASLNTVAFKAAANADGGAAELFLGMPEAERKGIFSLLTPETKEAGPPPFVPADALKFSRWRIDGKKAWATLESMLENISPEIASSLQLALGMLGKDRDPDFDLKSTLLSGLGDDFITYQKGPRAATLAELNSPPSIFLIGSPNPDKLALALRTVAGVMPVAKRESALKEREFLGRKIYSVPIMSPPAKPGEQPVERNFNFAASGGYLAISTDASMIEEFLRNGDTAPKPLRETAGLSDAVQKVGGMSTGLFGYENQRENMRNTFQAVKQDRTAADNLFSFNFAAGKFGSAPNRAGMKQWFDFSLLPSFESVAKYFYLAVYAANPTSQGLSWKFYTPTPPQLR